MTFFQGANNYVINGGNFMNVGGDLDIDGIQVHTHTYRSGGTGSGTGATTRTQQSSSSRHGSLRHDIRPSPRRGRTDPHSGSSASSAASFVPTTGIHHNVPWHAQEDPQQTHHRNISHFSGMSGFVISGGNYNIAGGDIFSTNSFVQGTYSGHDHDYRQRSNSPSSPLFQGSLWSTSSVEDELVGLDTQAGGTRESVLWNGSNFDFEFDSQAATATPPQEQDIPQTESSGGSVGGVPNDDITATVTMHQGFDYSTPPPPAYTPGPVDDVSDEPPPPPYLGPASEASEASETSTPRNCVEESGGYIGGRRRWPTTRRTFDDVYGPFMSGSTSRGIL